jgi:hypothetical protein
MSNVWLKQKQTLDRFPSAALCRESRCLHLIHLLVISPPFPFPRINATRPVLAQCQPYLVRPSRRRPYRKRGRSSRREMRWAAFCASHPTFRPPANFASQAIRKKIESELSRKRTISTTNSMRNNNKRGSRMAAAKGTVAALRPSPALTVPENITVAEASQLCAAKRTDCVLVVDDEEGLSGIFTAKDMAYRVRSLVALVNVLLDGIARSPPMASTLTQLLCTR